MSSLPFAKHHCVFRGVDHLGKAAVSMGHAIPSPIQKSQGGREYQEEGRDTTLLTLVGRMRRLETARGRELRQILELLIKMRESEPAQ
jgi:hypothetical protein